MEKYEYLNSKDWGYEPAAVEQAKFEYSPLAKNFNKRLEKGNIEDRIVKRLNTAEGKNEEQFKAVKDQGEKQLKVITKQNEIKAPLLKNIRKKEMKNDNVDTKESLKII